MRETVPVCPLCFKNQDGNDLDRNAELDLVFGEFCTKCKEGTSLGIAVVCDGCLGKRKTSGYVFDVSLFQKHYPELHFEKGDHIVCAECPRCADDRKFHFNES